jgi:hypothetical protein
MGSFFNPPAANVQAPTLQTYQPGGLNQADPSALGGISNLGNFNAYASLNPQVQGIGQNLVSDPNAQGFLQGAGTAAGLGMGAAANAFGEGGLLMGLGQGIANTAFDPQQALYGRTAQQTQDQTRAGLEARGVDNTPYGAGIEGQAMNNFNIDWQNQQLQRQALGGQSAGALIGQGAGLQAGAPGQYLTASGMPYATSQGIGQGQLGTLGQLGQFGNQGAAIPQQQIQDYLSYLGWGTGAQAAGNQAQNQLFASQLKQADMASQEQQSMFKGLGQLAGGIAGTAIGGPGGGTVGSMLAGKIFG